MPVEHHGLFNIGDAYDTLLRTSDILFSLLNQLSASTSWERLWNGSLRKGSVSLMDHLPAAQHFCIFCL
jgi:hypothetical protein